MSDIAYQVFLSHSSADKDFVRQVAARLKQDGVRYWFDEERLQPGEPWQKAIEEALPACESCAVFLNAAGRGPWHEAEMRAALSEQFEDDRGFRVIPVLLPGADASHVPLFLRQLTWVAFQDEPAAYEAAYQRLLRGIRGDEPDAFVPPRPAYLAAKECTDKIVPRGLRSFDAEDHVWFLRLVPGQQDRGLPSCLRFWKTRLEQVDSAGTFRVGLIYGPSGCGKSSLVKAGLIPTLAEYVVPIYVEASADRTEAVLLRELRTAVAGLPDDLPLSQTLAYLRDHPETLGGRKVVLLLDQFEQWLHAHRGDADSELAAASALLRRRTPAGGHPGSRRVRAGGPPVPGIPWTCGFRKASTGRRPTCSTRTMRASCWPNTAARIVRRTRQPAWMRNRTSSWTASSPTCRTATARWSRCRSRCWPRCSRAGRGRPRRCGRSAVRRAWASRSSKRLSTAARRAPRFRSIARRPWRCSKPCCRRPA